MHGWVCEGLADIVPSAEAGYTMTLPLPDTRARLMSHMAATLNIDWLLALIEEAARLAGAPSMTRPECLARLNEIVLAAAPAQAIFHPYVCDNGERGPFVDPCARAQLSGFTGSLGLAGMARAVFEGIALAARDCYAALGPLPGEIRLSGGAAKSAALRQLLASVTGRPVRVSHREECGAAGAALIAAVALGRYESVREALPIWVDAYLDEQLTLPDTAQATVYDALYPIYRDIAANAREPWQALARLRQPLSSSIAEDCRP
jgi:erythritol kinase